ncbi:Histone acetyltransferase type B catalytic subunit [Wickerhamomyces ciferrii]|uniref:Histone acetyltransferase type B catalytic subunit n=1 Tax=Wickerhamomyces ciferrii (strain ATCC 14091 / BCRC 22168 / CBS 111 / JCM 3599 / NBRC 0793 / NRRL Y-1031 F-60-10) TaxID=1206466 RepID=K0KKI7_WICCF|nr:Histone acetyltransferase type B catalytic subunit [Wickerhamomyces ciferrii]CCH43491.1 Histone acetyltransferase type B catalytic subunit [Wickerhamomyces ciferrii]
MSYNPETWTISSNEALKVSIADDQGYISFSPLFTYPIFGDAEQIFGYKDLKINLVFDSITFLPFLKVNYSEKLNDEVDDIQKKILGFLPSSTIIDDEAKWIDTFTQEQKELKRDSWELINDYNVKNEDFQVFKTNFKQNGQDNLQSIELNKRLQIFVLLFIEAGSYIDTSDELWDLFLLVSKKTQKILGFTTAYSYFKYNGAQEFDSNDEIYTRNKISQFVIFPPYQKHQHGSWLYNSIVSYWMGKLTVKEITIEDPNEKFDDLRYRNDFKRLYEDGFINSLPTTLTKIDLNWFQIHAQQYKIELNQFKKLVEIGYLYTEQFKLARLIIKKRLYEKNKDGLLELELAIRNDKLQTAYESIKQDYDRIIDSIRVREIDQNPLKKQKI